MPTMFAEGDDNRKFGECEHARQELDVLSVLRTRLRRSCLLGRVTRSSPGR